MKKSVFYSLHAFILFTNFVIYFLILIKGHDITSTISTNGTSAFDLGYKFGKIIGPYVHSVILFYLGYFLIANKFFKKQKFFVFSISLVTIIAVLIVLPFIFENNWHLFSLEKYLISVFITLFICLYGFMFRVFIDWFNNQQEKKELESEKLRTKLLLLVNQNNSHFIFNVLNNIDSMISTKPAKASETISKLSQLLRYIYSNTETDKVLLSSEIEYLKNYIELQELRFDSTINIRLKKEGNLENIKLIPMIFLPFIENAFKHGIINNEFPLSIKIKLNQNKLYFECQNQFKKTEQANKTISGFGLPNITKRLDLMYPSKYTLNTATNSGLYIVSLTLQLDED